MTYVLDDIGKGYQLIEEMKRGFTNRDTIWQNRRKVRYREMEAELKSMPLNPRISNKALMVSQTEAANQEVHRRAKRLLANPPQLEVIVHESDTRHQALGQQLEDGLRALLKWMGRGKDSADDGVVECQQGDGLGIYKLDQVPGHGDSLAAYTIENLTSEEGPREVRLRRPWREFQRELEAQKRAKVLSPSTVAYANVTDRRLRTELPPFRLSSVDPLTCYWWEDGDGVEIIVEAGQRTLNPLLRALSDYGLRYSAQDKRFYVEETGQDAAGAATMPEGTTTYDPRQLVDYYEIRTRDEIAIILEHPATKGQRSWLGPFGKKPAGSERGLLLHFPNPFGPYTTGYVLVPGDITSNPDPANHYQPPILGTLNLAQPQNVLDTAYLSAALEKALSSKYVKAPDTAMLPPETAAEEQKVSEVKEGQPIPVIMGEVKRAESPNVELDKAAMRLAAEAAEYKFRDVLTGDVASAEASGHRLALQIAQADIQLVPYQNRRAKALVEVLTGIVYAIRKTDLPIYIPTVPDGARRATRVRVSEPASLTPEMADLNFDLMITLGAETAVTRYAKWEAMQRRLQEGTLGYQTVMEESDIVNPLEEIARVFEGKTLMAVMDQIVPVLVQMVVRARAQEKLLPAPPTQETVPGMPTPEQQMAAGAPYETGLAAGGGGPGPGTIRVPGVGISPAGPATKEYGPPVQEGGGEQRARVI